MTAKSAAYTLGGMLSRDRGDMSQAVYLSLSNRFRRPGDPASSFRPPETASAARRAGITRGRLHEQGRGQPPGLACGQADPDAGVAV